MNHFTDNSMRKAGWQGRDCGRFSSIIVPPLVSVVPGGNDKLAGPGGNEVFWVLVFLSGFQGFSQGANPRRS
jgi:hypothetical protein